MLKTTLKPLALTLAATTLLTQAPAVLADVNVDLRTFYFSRDFSEGGAASREALTQALRVDYVGQATENLNLGASLFANLKLTDDGDAHLTGLLDSDDGDSYAKLGQIYADYSFNDSISVRVGRWVISSVLLSDSDSRATPSSTQAIQLTNQFDKGQLYALYTDRASSKTDTSFTKYTDASGDDYGIVIVGGDLALENGLSLAAAYGDADGYKQQTFLNAGFQVNENVALSLTHYNGEGEGANAAFDSNLTNLAASYQFDNLKLSAAYQTISGDTGYDFTWGGDDDNVLQTSHSVQIMDFNRQDEDSWQLRADYAVSSVKGLSLMARHTWGDYTDSGNTVDEAETNVDVVYQLQSGFLQGLNLHMRLSNVNADAYADINEVRLIANYSF